MNMNLVQLHEKYQNPTRCILAFKNETGFEKGFQC